MLIWAHIIAAFVISGFQNRCVSTQSCPCFSAQQIAGITAALHKTVGPAGRPATLQFIGTTATGTITFNVPQTFASCFCDRFGGRDIKYVVEVTSVRGLVHRVADRFSEAERQRCFGSQATMPVSLNPAGSKRLTIVVDPSIAVDLVYFTAQAMFAQPGLLQVGPWASSAQADAYARHLGGCDDVYDTAVLSMRYAFWDNWRSEIRRTFKP